MLDGPLGGGLPRGLVTELVGEAGAGKSQLALQLLLTAQWPEERGGLAGRALYIHTEGVDPMRRLRDLAARQAERGLVGEDACDHIFLEACLGGAEDLLRVLERARGLAQRLGADGRPLRLLVVDSVGALFRDEVGGDGGRGGAGARAGARVRGGSCARRRRARGASSCSSASRRRSGGWRRTSAWRCWLPTTWWTVWRAISCMACRLATCGASSRLGGA